MGTSSFVYPRYQENRPGTSPLWVAATTFDRPSQLDIHVHPGVEVGLVLAGREEIHFSDFVVLCGTGGVWLCNTWEPHGWRIASPSTEIVVLIFAPEFVGEEMLGDLPWLTPFTVPPDQRPRVSSPQLRGKVLGIGHVLRGEITQRRASWQAVVRLELLRLLIELSRTWEGAKSVASLGPARVGTLARVMPALNLVHARPWHRVRVPEAAAACGLSISRFHSLFRSTMGVSFGAFCLRARLSFAAHQVLNTDRSVAAIAAQAGFVDDSHLHRHFVKQYACTPTQYRERSVSAPGRTRARAGS